MSKNNTIYKDTKQQHIENDWKELVSKGRHKTITSDERSFLVRAALQEKVETKHKSQDKSETEIQLEKSELHLQELIKFGNVLVNNIKSSHERQELLSSKRRHEKEIELQENLRKEAELSLCQFDKISKKWKDVNNLKEPMGIHEEMQRQRENIENLMASKNELIEQCEQELKNINKKYYENQEKQSEDICLLVERVDHQIRLLNKSYRSSFEDLQNTIEIEKLKILQTGKEQWNIVYDHLKDKETEKMETLKEKQKFYAQELDIIRNKQEEITRTTKIRLEKDTELLETEIRKTQANILMNSEKIDYNYQVLQKRNEENIIINNHQKRQAAKLNEKIVALTKKLVAIKGENMLAMDKLTVDIQKLHSSINDLHTKSQQFRKNNSIKLAKIWNINFQETKRLVIRVLEIDRILYEQQLGRKWKHPKINFDELEYTKYFQPFPNAQKKILVPQPIRRVTNQKYMHDILCKISDRAGFLIEDKLIEILAPYTDEEQCLVKIESIFAALGITNIKEVESLMKCFEPYSCCKNCSSERAKTISNGDDSMNSKEIVCKNHTLYMDPGFVLCALNDFMSRELKLVGKSSEATRKSKTESDLDLIQIDRTDISSYWQQFASHMSKEQQNVWKSIEHGLNHYLEVLKRRAHIDNECVFLQNQNGELKHLLQKL